MNELIKIEKRNGIDTINARELWEFLEVGREFSTWIKERILKYEFIEGIDYIRFDQIVKGDINGFGNKTYKNYYITINMAKELSMVENNDKGKEARKYFIECEQKLKQINTVIDISKMEESEIISKGYELALKQYNTVKEKYLLLIHSSKLYTATEIAKELNIKSAQELNQILELKKIQYKVNDTWVLSAQYADKEYTSIKQQELDNGIIIYDRKWTGKGRDFILNLFKLEN